jgi:hypothetical protein
MFSVEDADEGKLYMVKANRSELQELLDARVRGTDGSRQQALLSCRH